MHLAPVGSSGSAGDSEQVLLLQLVGGAGGERLQDVGVAGVAAVGSCEDNGQGVAVGSDPESQRIRNA